MNQPVRTLTTFQSDDFNTTEPREYFVNPGCFGDDVCIWLIREFTNAGIRCDPEPDQEDFGWYFNFWMSDVKYCLVCGFRPPDGNDPGVWIGWIERSTGFLAGLFGGRDKQIDTLVPQQIHQVLSGSDKISNIRWHLKKDFDCGNENAALNSPG